MEQQYIKDLLKPSAYPEVTRTVTLVQTHVSLLFLTDNHVYKIKKPVDLGFLNFTTVDRRRFYCEEEVRLNRRLCPDIYLGVVQLRESGEGVTFHTDGRIVDYAVRMRRLPEERMLDRLLRENLVKEAAVKKIARTIAEFHKRAERSDEIDRYGGLQTIAANWEENLRQIADSVGITIERKDLELIQDWVNDFMEREAPLFARRISGGFIRDCDGDIHAGNICLADKVYIFDCIEFNKRFRYIDTAADIAFLVMDLDYHNNMAYAEILVREYLSASNDTGLTGLLDFYKIYRAFVRGKVESIRLHDREIPAQDRAAAKESAKRHFRLATGYILRRKLAPSLIIFSGLMGTGKSTISSRLAFELGLNIVRSDVIRKKIAETAETVQSFFEFGEGIYSDDFTLTTYEKLLSAGETALASGRSIIIDASCSRKCHRELFRTLSQKLAVGFYIIQTDCSDDLARTRLTRRLQNGTDPSDGRWELFYRQKARFERID
ncbi:MAG: AAA family ATPase, partial [Deltaproteobacteria bacterium]